MSVFQGTFWWNRVDRLTIFGVRLWKAIILKLNWFCFFTNTNLLVTSTKSYVLSFHYLLFHKFCWCVRIYCMSREVLFLTEIEKLCRLRGDLDCHNLIRWIHSVAHSDYLYHYLRCTLNFLSYSSFVVYRVLKVTFERLRLRVYSHSLKTFGRPTHALPPRS